jgi:hypothetical protein
MAGKRMNGEDSLYRRSSDGRWFASVVESDELGRPKRRTVSAKTKEGGARDGLKRLVEEHERLAAEGLAPIDGNVTLGQLLDRWHKAMVATRRETTAIDYHDVIDKHLVGFVLPQGRALGTKRLSVLTFADRNGMGSGHKRDP